MRAISSASGIATLSSSSGLLARSCRSTPVASSMKRTLRSSAFHSFCDRIGRGQFPQLADRDDLWRLLVTITARKAVSTVRHQNRKKRGGGKVQGESAFLEPGSDEAANDGLAGFLSREPTPEVAAQFAEEYDRLIDKLQNPALKTIALRTLDGHSAEEIAAQLGTSPRTVHRKLQLIRALWDEEMAG